MSCGGGGVLFVLLCFSVLLSLNQCLLVQGYTDVAEVDQNINYSDNSGLREEFISAGGGGGLAGDEDDYDGVPVVAKRSTGNQFVQGEISGGSRLARRSPVDKRQQQKPEEEDDDLGELSGSSPGKISRNTRRKLATVSQLTRRTSNHPSAAGTTSSPSRDNDNSGGGSRLFTCSMGTVIPRDWVCDGRQDCDDGSDEEPGQCSSKCHPEHFQCHITQKCIPNQWTCDGEFDCEVRGDNRVDRSDEEDARCFADKKCPPNKALCSFGICLEISKFCDGRKDCANDEVNCSQEQCRPMHCSFNCKVTPQGPMCYCAPGLQPNGTDCVDMDECQVDNVCDQKCINTPGSFKCECTDGYTLNGTNCWAINNPPEEPASMILLTGNRLQRIKLDGTLWSPKTVKDLVEPRTVEVIHMKRQVCAVHDLPNGTGFNCYDIDDFEKSSVEIVGGLNFSWSTVTALKYDWIGDNWYLKDDRDLHLCDSNFRYCRKVFDGEAFQTKSIALDPTKGLLFFTSWDHKTADVMKASMSGENFSSLASYKVIHPHAITLDLPNERVYWVDSYMNYIEGVDYNGKERVTIKRPVTNAFLLNYTDAVVQFENKLYVTQMKESSILSINRHNFELNRVAKLQNHTSDLLIFHRQLQPMVSHPCRINKGGCEHICVPIWRNSVAIAKCLCEQGFAVVEGKCVVVPRSHHIIYSTSEITGVSLNGTKAVQSMPPITRIGRFTEFDVSAKTETVFYSQTDFQTSQVISQKVNGTARKVLYNAKSFIKDLAYDWIGQNLYIVEIMKVSVMPLKNTTHIKRLDLETNLFWAIALDPTRGIMFIRAPNGIVKSWMDGTNETFALADTPTDFKIFLDISKQKLYTLFPNGLHVSDYDLKRFDPVPVTIDSVDSWCYWDNRLLYHTFDGVIWSKSITEDNSSVPLAIYKESNRMNSIRVMDIKSQPGTGNCSCPSLCLITPKGFTCACQDNYSLNAMGTECLPRKPSEMGSVNCTTGNYRCKDGTKCVNHSLVCDGMLDCLDGSDEAHEPNGPCVPATAGNEKCNSSTHFQCDLNRCIELKFLCDGASQCNDQSDESPTICGEGHSRPQVVCSEHLFQCQISKKCIPIMWVCDKNFDCGLDDTSDEPDTCHTECEEFACTNGLCLNFEYLCDGVDNCGDNSDESQCESDCLEGEFYCGKVCLSDKYLCDGYNDCDNGEDESNCSTVIIPSDNAKMRPEIHCGPKEFQCANKIECIAEGLRCNGHKNCLDGSDEKDCFVVKKSNGTSNKGVIRDDCMYPSRLCGQGTEHEKCVKVTQLCDGRTDCIDGSDEGLECGEKLCDHVNECSHECHNTPEGFICSCPPGMHLAADQFSCTRRNVCQEWGICSQKCIEEGGRYRCACEAGYFLQYDNFSCRSEQSDPQYILFTSRQELVGIHLNTLAVKPIYKSAKNAIALDFFYSSNATYIYWSDVQEDKIYRGLWTAQGQLLEDVQPVIESGLNTAEGLAVDWIGENLYWVDSHLDQIEVATMNGQYRKTLVAGNIVSPRGIALDPRDGYLFWSDWDKDLPRIERVSLAGEYREVIVQIPEVNGAWPNGLTLDFVHRRIYWIDANSDSIHTTLYDGKDHRLVITDQDTLSHPFAISLHENNVFWTDWRTNSVIRANKWNGSDLAVIHRVNVQPFGIQVMHSSRQPRDGKSPCASNPCSHLCLINIKRTFKCDCPHMMRLQADGKTCVANDHVLLYISGAEIRGVDVENPEQFIIPTVRHNTQVMTPGKLEYLYKEKKLFWTDTSLNLIKSTNLTTGPLKSILDTDVVGLNGFAIDWAAKVMFFANEDPELGTRILASNLEGEFITEIHRDLKTVESIAVDPIRGKMYFSHSDHKTFRQIEESSMDGTQRSMLVMTEKVADSLTLDLETRRLYYVVASLGAIYYVDLETRKTVNVLNINLTQYVSSVTVFGNMIYYANKVEETIRRCSKDSCIASEVVKNNTNDIVQLRMFYEGAQKGTNLCAQGVRNGCDHLCVATGEGKSKCVCAIGFKRDRVDEKKCLGSDEFLFYSLSFELKGLPLHEDLQKYNYTVQRMLPPIPGISLASLIDYHAELNAILWADSDRGLIIRSKLDGTQRHIIVDFGHAVDMYIEAPTGLAVDWVANNLYWSDAERGIIEVSRLDGTHRYVVAFNLKKPKKLAIDPAMGFLFYAGESVIGRIGLDGSSPFVVNNQSAVDNSIFLDVTNQVVYWCEMQTGKVKQADYDGNRLTTLIGGGLEHPIAIAIANGRMFIAESIQMRSSLKVVLMEDTKAMFTIANESSRMRDFKIFSAKMQSIATNSCKKTICAELCLYNGTYPVCACSHGKLAADGKSCEAYDTFLLYSKGQSIESVHVTNKAGDPNEPIQKIMDENLMKNAIGLSYDYKRKGIFYSDIHWKSINWVLFNGSDHRKLVKNVGGVEGLAYEPLTDTLLWTSSQNASICMIHVAKALSMDESSNSSDLVQQVIRLKPTDRPRGIAVEPCLSMVYWTNWEHQASIKRAFISGYGTESIITTNIKVPNAIALDLEAHKLYWADARLDKIERADYDGTHRIVLSHSAPQHPFALAIYGDLLFWTDWRLQSVVRVNKYSGSDVVHIRTGNQRPMGVVVIQNASLECEANPCKRLNGGCEDRCAIDINGKVMCLCTQGTLGPDKRRCIPQFTKERPIQQCKLDEFTCPTGACIPYELTCDGVDHCEPATDELESLCVFRTCPVNFIQCKNNRCVPKKKVCNGHDDCGDGTDEETCQCQPADFHCSSGECIRMSRRCDGQSDCKDRSDELDCPKRFCNITTHKTGEVFLCSDQIHCYLPDWACDGVHDCLDGTDEMGCPAVSDGDACPINSFKCSSGKCIPQKWVCDGEPDCADGDDHDMVQHHDSSDERNCEDSCDPDSFVCTGNFQCIPASWRCDGTPDCDDGTDEGDHCPPRTCSDDFYQCNGSSQCLPFHMICDGNIDCLHGDDEETCTEYNICPPLMFSCRSGTCLDLDHYCDGKKDCPDGSDEQEGCLADPWMSTGCQSGYFQCHNGDCILKNLTCNGSDDCGDGSDEKEVCEDDSPWNCNGTDKFHCPTTGACITEDLVCDGNNDCGAFEDEMGCNINECETAEGKVCMHKCVDKKIGFECQCNPGFKVNEKNALICSDINECEDKPCSQICQNTYGSYRCSCVDGFQLHDHTKCKAIGDHEAKLILTNRYYIREVSLTGHQRLVLHNLTNPVGLDYDIRSNCYFWSDVTTVASYIRKWCPSKGNKTEVLHHSALQSPEGLAIDWIGRNLYWCNKGLDLIEVSTMEGRYRKALITELVKDPRAIALDPFEKFMYWTDWGSNPHIGKAGMDGSNPRIIITEDLEWPNALTINYETKELFFGDAVKDYIAMTDLEGRNRRVIVRKENHPGLSLGHIFALAVWEDRIYWTDWDNKSLVSCEKYHGANCTIVTQFVHKPMDLRIVHPSRQKMSEINPCDKANCSTLCVLSPDAPGYKCLCPDNFYLGNDGRTCLDNCTASHFRCHTTFKCIPFYWRCDTQNDCGDNSDESPDCPPFHCAPGQFQCKNKACITPNLICNGVADCLDGSDEVDCNDFTCFNSQFRCGKSANRTAFCISADKRCNKAWDCPNGEDEENCPTVTCSANERTCAPGICIPKLWECDGDQDCPDGIDEQGCGTKKCLEKDFQCASGRCIPSGWLCDGERDCADGGDEKNCTQTAKCPSNSFQCHNTKCVPNNWRCDEENDCGDNSDEMGCHRRNCSESEYQCPGGKCIPGGAKCDGTLDCADGSDELNCHLVCKPDELKCDNGQKCYPKAHKCDGDADCEDFSDEKDCSCQVHQFQCSNGRCIDMRHRCDGWIDCADGSDEFTKVCKKYGCSVTDAIQCKNYKCVNRMHVCDGYSNCDDGADERPALCHALNKCPDGHFMCESDHICVNQHFVCDGTPNCADGSDERNCHRNKTTGCVLGACSQLCTEKPTQQKKYEVHAMCSCAEGYILDQSDRTSCRASDWTIVELIVASEHKLNVYDLRKQKQRPTQSTILPDYSKIISFDVLRTKNDVILVWIDWHNHMLHKLTGWLKTTSSWETDESGVIVVNGLGKAISLSIDWLTGTIYVIDAKTNLILATDLTGTKLTMIVSTGPSPSMVKVDPVGRRLYWSSEVHGGIMTSGMDGSDKRIMKRDTRWITSIAFDYPSRRMYWVDRGMRTIESIGMDDKDLRMVMDFQKLNETLIPFSLDVFENDLVVAFSNGKLMHMDKYGASAPVEYLHADHEHSLLAVYHPLKQNTGKMDNPCAKDPCHSTSRCVLSTEGRTCMCPLDMIMSTVDSMLSTTFCIPKEETIPCSLRCNSGKCQRVNGTEVCACTVQFTGKHCETYRCSNWCKNKGNCYVDENKKLSPGEVPPLKCQCSSQWTGDRCEISSSMCRKNCHNGASCTFVENETRCHCAAGYLGKKCEHCEDMMCQNGGVCRKTALNTSGCDCPDGFMGKMCENNTCEGFCSQNGDCKVGVTGPRCECHPGYSGVRCEIRSCELECGNGGTCILSGGQSTCSCPPRFTGYSCEMDLCESDDASADCISMTCERLKCMNGGECIIKTDGPACDCPLGHSGNLCEINDNEICSGFCENGATCKVNPATREPHCLCAGEWRGSRCDVPPDCYFGCGICVQDSNINECQCPDGQIKPCKDVDQAIALNDKEETASQVLVTLIVIMVILLVGIMGVGSYMMWFRRRRLPFHHARLGENVEITNPMYTGDVDDGPVFISDHDKQHFANPVYDSMYKGGGGPGLNSGDREMDTFDRGEGSSLTELENLGRTNPKMASEEKKGLLEYNQE